MMISDRSPNSNTQSQLAIPDASKQFLRLYFDPEIALLPISQITEVLNISAEQIMPIPHMSPWMMGAYNWRGDILWLVDLGHLAGLTPLYQKALSTLTYTVVILQVNPPEQTEGQILGLVINQVGNIERCDPDSFKTASANATTELETFLQGYWLKSEREILAVLDPDAIWLKVSQSPVVNG